MISSISYLSSSLAYPLSACMSGIGSLHASITSVFQATIPSNSTTTNNDNSFSSHFNILATVSTAALAIGIYINSKSETIIRNPPVGLPNGGNHCCFISALQVLLNTESWRRVLDAPALRPVLTAYQRGSTSQLNFEKIRQQVDIFEDNQSVTQQDPAAYIRSLAAAQDKRLSIKSTYCTKEGTLIHDRGILPPDDPLISLGIPKGSSLALEALLENYFCNSFEAYYSKEQDKLVEAKGEKTLMKNSLAGSPPDDLMIQIKRFGFKTTNESAANVQTNTVSFFQKIKLIFLRLFGLYTEPSIVTAVFVPSSQLGGYKIKDPIATPLTLKMKPQWLDGQEVPVSYECQSFLCHIGEEIRSGHYIAYVRKGDTWYKCNDNTVTAISETAAKDALQSSYILSYRKVVDKSLQTL